MELKKKTCYLCNSNCWTLPTIFPRSPENFCGRDAWLNDRINFILLFIYLFIYLFYYYYFFFIFIFLLKFSDQCQRLRRSKHVSAIPHTQSISSVCRLHIHVIPTDHYTTLANAAGGQLTWLQPERYTTENAKTVQLLVAAFFWWLYSFAFLTALHQYSQLLQIKVTYKKPAPRLSFLEQGPVFILAIWKRSL